MKRAAAVETHGELVPATTAVRIRLRQKDRNHRVPEKTEGTAGIPRVARLLALAHKIDSMVRSGELKNWAEAAKLIGITRARMTQIASLLLLAPEIQEAIMQRSLEMKRRDSFSERRLRPVAAMPNWATQDRVALVSEIRSSV